MSLDVDLEREQNIEELRRIAQALKAQNQLLLASIVPGAGLSSWDRPRDLVNRE